MYSILYSGLSLSFLVQGLGPIGLGKLLTLWGNLGNFTLTIILKKLLKYALIVLRLTTKTTEQVQLGFIFQLITWLPLSKNQHNTHYVQFVKLGITSLENWEF